MNYTSNDIGHEPAQLSFVHKVTLETRLNWQHAAGRGLSTAAEQHAVTSSKVNFNKNDI
jgi:hypothetical protein